MDLFPVDFTSLLKPVLGIFGLSSDDAQINLFEQSYEKEKMALIKAIQSLNRPQVWNDAPDKDGIYFQPFFMNSVVRWIQSGNFLFISFFI